MQPTQSLPLVAAILAAFLFGRIAFGTPPGWDPLRRAPVPEPFFTETATDIDGKDAGELELELNASELRAL